MRVHVFFAATLAAALALATAAQAEESGWRLAGLDRCPGCDGELLYSPRHNYFCSP